MTAKMIGAVLAGISLALATPAVAQTAAAAPATAAVAAKPAKMLVPADFVVPTLAKGPSFKLVPLGPALVKVDFDAYMSSIEHLQKTFSRSTGWPHAGISDADAMKDMEGEAARFAARKSFAYGVLTPDGKRERGSVYVSTSPVPGYDAMVRLWVTKAEYDAGFDAALYGWVQQWVARQWPFAKVAYPGRSIAWETWDAKVKAAKGDHLPD
ncbi:MAG: twin-arginine translocation pathway signal protein [Novosphingobium sp.]|nr:twin-arginine translocation pathway signal protein [Novosphingobium sp.]